MKLGIVTDSTSDLPTDLIQRFGIEVVPTILIIEGQQYADGEGISRNDFYARLPGMRQFPTTAAPSIGTRNGLPPSPGITGSARKLGRSSMM